MSSPGVGAVDASTPTREEDEAAREDEPFVTGILGETTLLREVFFDALSRPGRVPAMDDFERFTPCMPSHECAAG